MLFLSLKQLYSYIIVFFLLSLAFLVFLFNTYFIVSNDNIAIDNVMTIINVIIINFFFYSIFYIFADAAAGGAIPAACRGDARWARRGWGIGLEGGNQGGPKEWGS